MYKGICKRFLINKSSNLTVMAVDVSIIDQRIMRVRLEENTSVVCG